MIDDDDIKIEETSLEENIEIEPTLIDDEVKRRSIPTPLLELAMTGQLEQFEGENLYSTNHCRYIYNSGITDRGSTHIPPSKPKKFMQNKRTPVDFLP